MKNTTLLAFALLIFSCNNNPASTTPETAQEEPTDAMPEGFSEFYGKFHADSVFQMEHIVFPLEGLPDNADSLTITQATFRWTPENWRMMRAFDFQMSEFTREITPFNERMVIERIVHKTNGHGMVRRFAIVAGEWHLIYYAGMNKLR